MEEEFFIWAEYIATGYLKMLIIILKFLPVSSVDPACCSHIFQDIAKAFFGFFNFKEFVLVVASIIVVLMHHRY